MRACDSYLGVNLNRGASISALYSNSLQRYFCRSRIVYVAETFEQLH